MSEETTKPTETATPSDEATDPKATAAPQETSAKPKEAAAKPKKEKPPALEDKPFQEFVRQDYIPALQAAFAKQGIEDLCLELENRAISVTGVGVSEPCWQIIGRWNQNKRQFNLYFLDENIQGHRAFSCASNGSNAAILEPFLCDERKITLDLLVFGLMKRLNGQKWLARN